MFTIAAQLLAAVLLGSTMWLAYRKWVRPHKDLDWQQRGALLLTLLAFAGGLLGSPFWWLDEPRSFAWDLPPLASRMLASAGLSFFVLCLLALQRPTFRRIRLVMLLLFVYLAPLATAIFLFHLDRFDPALPITYTFFATAIVMTVASTWYLVRPSRAILADTQGDTVASDALVKVWLSAVTLVTGVWGLALFITDRGPSDLIWVWPGDLLSSRLIGAMLLTIAAGSAYSLRNAKLSQVMMATTSVYSLGLAIASLWNVVAGKPIKLAYLVGFGVIFVVSVFLQVRIRSSKPPARVGE